MGGCHKLHWKQRLIYKHSNCIGNKEFCIDAGIIEPDLAAQAIKGHHHYRCIVFHKECLDTMVLF